MRVLGEGNEPPVDKDENGHHSKNSAISGEGRNQKTGPNDGTTQRGFKLEPSNILRPGVVLWRWGVCSWNNLTLGANSGPTERLSRITSFHYFFPLNASQWNGITVRVRLHLSLPTIFTIFNLSEVLVNTN